MDLHRAGRVEEAMKKYRDILARFPDEPDCNHLLGMLLCQQGNYAEAETLMRRSLQSGSAPAQWHSNFAMLCRLIGKHDEALSHLQRAIQIDPKIAEIHENLGTVLDDLNRLPEAVAAYMAGVNLRPDSPSLHARLGWAMRRLNQFDQAIAHLQRANQLQPDHPEILLNLGKTLADAGKEREALIHLERVAQLFPNHVEPLGSLAFLLARLREFDRSEQLYRRALQIDPNSAPLLNQLAHLLLLKGDIAGAIQVARQAIQIAPNFAAGWTNLGLAQVNLGDSLQAAESFRKSLEIAPDDLFVRSNLLLTLHTDPDIDPPAMFAEHQKYQQIIAKFGIKPMSHKNSRDPERRLRIGYVSPDFRRHPVASFVEPILRNHDRMAFEITCYADERGKDEVTERLRGLAARWVNTSHLDDVALAQQINADGQDILIDLAGHTANGRLPAFAFKPAPVQVTYLGYLNTTGLDAMDYRLTDAIADSLSEADPFYTERLLRLPCFFCYQPSAEAPEVGPLPASKNGRITFGSLNHPGKFNSRVIEVWARLLQMIPDSRLMLTIGVTGNEDRLREMFARHGVQIDRLVLVPRQSPAEYYDLYNSVDIALDPFPFSGHTTSCDALWMGVPVVTMPGKSYASRTCTSVLTHISMQNLIAGDTSHYCEIAAQLTRDIPKLSGLRECLRSRVQNSIITNGQEFTRNLEVAYRQIWRNWCSSSG